LSLRHAYARFTTRLCSLFLSRTLVERTLSRPASSLSLSLFLSTRRRFRHHRRVPTAACALHLLNRFRSPSQNNASLSSLILASAFSIYRLSSSPVVFLTLFFKGFRWFLSVVVVLVYLEQFRRIIFMTRSTRPGYVNLVPSLAASLLTADVAMIEIYFPE